MGRVELVKLDIALSGALAVRVCVCVAISQPPVRKGTPGDRVIINGWVLVDAIQSEGAFEIRSASPNGARVTSREAGNAAGCRAPFVHEVIVGQNHIAEDLGL